VADLGQQGYLIIILKTSLARGLLKADTTLDERADQVKPQFLAKKLQFCGS